MSGGSHMTPEGRARIAEKARKRMMGNRYRRGKKMPESAKAKISASLIGNQRRRGKPHPPEIRARIGKSLERAYAEGRHRIAVSTYWRGKRHTEESKRKISEARRRRRRELWYGLPLS